MEFQILKIMKETTPISRRVRFRDFNPAQQLNQTRQFDNDRDRMVRVTISRQGSNGETITAEDFVSQEQFRRLLPRNEAGSRSSDRLFGPRDAYQRSPRRSRRGALSWQTSDGSDTESDEYHLRDFRNSNHSSLPERRGRTAYGPTTPMNRGSDSAVKIGGIVSNWKLTFPGTEKDPEQFLLILKDRLSSSGIDRNQYIPYLSNVFEGPYRAWYILNKGRWKTWKEFAHAFRYQWGVKKQDGDLFLEVRDLKSEKGESLAEFTCRARLIFERMQRPPPFRDQLKQILVKFNPRLIFEVLNLPIYDYDQFLHYINERSYLYRRSLDASKEPRGKSTKAEFRHLQEELGENQDSESTRQSDSDEKPPQLRQISQNKNNASRQQGNSKEKSKTLTRQRLEGNLARFENNKPKQNQTKEPLKKVVLDPNKMFCYNCGQTKHTARFCTADRQVVCFICKKIGHVNKDCNQASGNDQAPQ